MLTENLERQRPFGHPEHQMDGGNCPVCGQAGELMNIYELGWHNWFVCRAHRLRWWFGSGWFKGLGIASDEDRRALETYQDAKPVYGLEAEQLRMQHATDDDVALAWPSLESAESRHDESNAGRAGQHSVRPGSGDETQGTGLPPV